MQKTTSVVGIGTDEPLYRAISERRRHLQRVRTELVDEDFCSAAGTLQYVPKKLKKLADDSKTRIQ